MAAKPQLYVDFAGAILDTDTWGNRAACIGKAHILENPDLEAQAKAMCLGAQATGQPRCPVIDDCHRWVIPLKGKEDPGGVRAGRTENERNAFRRSRTVGHRAKNDKYCARCENTKPRSEFYRHRRYKDGLATYCKTCHAAMRAAQRARKAAA
jgi:hypothetical protein